jgi:hypothetical protein
MAVPVIQSRSEAKLSSNGTSITITAPTSITDGDLLLCVLALDGNHDQIQKGHGLTIPTGFRQIFGQENQIALALFYKIASSESGNYTFGWVSSEACIANMYRIDGIVADEGSVLMLPGQEQKVTATSATITPALPTDSADMLIMNFAAIDRDAGQVDAGGDADYTLEDADKTAGSVTDRIGYAVQSQSQATKGTTPDACTYTASTSDDIIMTWLGIRSAAPDGPVVRSKSRAETSVAASLVFTAPAGIVDGDLLLIMMAVDDAMATEDTITIPSGFSILDEVAQATAVSVLVYYKVASSESGTYTVSWSGSAESAIGEMWRIGNVRSGAEVQDPAENTTGSGSSNTLTPATATNEDDNLVIGVFAQDGDDVAIGIGDDSDYRLDTAEVSGAGGVGDTTLLIYSRVQETAGTPPAITHSVLDAATEEFAATWLAVRPPAGVGGAHPVNPLGHPLVGALGGPVG